MHKYGGNDFLSFVLGTLGLALMAEILKATNINYPEVAGAIICVLVYIFLF